MSGLEAHQAGASGADLQPPSQASAASVLLVDDQPARLLTYEAILAGLGVHCVRALSGTAALAALLDEQFAAILLDVQMPEMDGFEVARLIRAHPRYEQTPIIFVTGVHVNELDQLKGYQAGAIDYISVPVVPEILRSKVAVLIELHHRRRELALLNRALKDAREQLVSEHAKALADTQAQVTRLFEHPTDSIVMLRAERDSSGTISNWTYQNANANALRFLDRTRESIAGALLDAVLPERASKVAALARQTLETGEPVRYEDRVGERDFLITMFALDKDCVVSCAADITDRTRAETALRENERRFRALLEHAPVAVAHNALDGRFEYVNKAFCQLVGYSPEELLTKTWQQITHPDDVALDQSYAQEVLAGKAPHYTIQKRYLRKDERPVWVRFFGNFVFDDAGNVLQGVAVAIDITAQRSAEEKVRESEQRFRDLANNMDQLAWTCSELGVAEWYNDRWYEYTGTTLEEMRATGWTKVQHPEHLDRVMAGLRHSLRSGQPWEETFPLRGKDGQFRWFLSRAIPIRDDAGHIKRWFGTNTDVTELRRLEEALKESGRRKDEFLAMLSHELRNPIAPIRSAAEVLARLASRDERLLEMSRIIQRQAQHLSGLLDDLLEVARITQGRIELRREVLPLAECIQLAVETVEPLIREKGHELGIRHEARPVYLDVDRARIVLCLANILSNAAKYTPSGGRISVASHADSSNAVIEVSDNGIGIPERLLPRVFDLFVQGEQSLARSRGGLGIGLAVCKRLVEMHGGTVSARSDGDGRGATFAIRLPLADKPALVSSESSARAAGVLRVLLVDDNQDAANSMALILQTDGHTTRAVYSAESAIEEACDFKPDVILLDIGLPGMDGYAAARRLRQLVPSARLIALTGYGRAEDRRRAEEAGFDGHLLKPVDPAALGKMLGQRPLTA